MYQSMTVALALLSLIVSAAPIGPAEHGKTLTQQFYARDIATLWSRMDDRMQAAMKSQVALTEFRDQVENQLGVEESVIEETVETDAGLQMYTRKAKFSKFSGYVIVQWALTPDGKVAGFQIAPAKAGQIPAASKHENYRTKTLLRLPFDQPFLVFWGGRTLVQNYHAAHANQRFAYDMLVSQAGTSRAGKSQENDDYYCFGKPLLAPAGGTVVQAVDGVADNLPCKLNPAALLGNHVIINHGNGEYSLLAHLRQGSTRVKAGDIVVSSQLLGECGNSGNSSEPHLHYQLQDGPTFGSAASLPAQFVQYLADDQPVARGEPVKGQTVRPARTF
ncbi:hypothetical protein GCM10007907_35590 [Chitinimonas prasina]|uniref:M23ase beta-sheet core domain-containing protein n=1 Tax=Chitinimonas prasina TaxID=1434937 RepID=A0ABQ5YJG5_9NEIS|nr:M23 family metallopeptidase [Chitinimonas prasina]GLR14769.1 hypothetical protein GCM10007907_35590 [Chitinimonas prasina]